MENTGINKTQENTPETKDHEVASELILETSKTPDTKDKPSKGTIALAALAGAAINLFTWVASSSGIHQWNMLFPILLTVNIVALLIVFAIYYLTRLVHSQTLRGILCILVFAAHASVTLVTAHFIIPSQQCLHVLLRIMRH